MLDRIPRHCVEISSNQPDAAFSTVCWKSALISHIKLLVNSDFSIIQVAYESGFRNISHFNHKFKEMSGLSPLEYRRAHQTKLSTEYLEEELPAIACDE